jgi:hypothetical protein
VRIQTLTATAAVVLNGSGTATAQVGPVNPGEIWYPGTASVGEQPGLTITNEAQCRVYVGSSPSPPNYVDGTLSGSTGDSTTNVAGKVVFPGSYIWAVWTGGDAGAPVTLNVSGTKRVP